ncbi:glycoside hydrolase [Trichoderma novae-zelandiae]
MAAPYPPSIDLGPTGPVPDSVDFSPKKPNGGNYMPSKSTNAPVSKTVNAPAVGNQLEARVTGERVTNGVARFDNSNILDGVGNGVDSYTMYWGDGSTGAGWPAQSRWVSFQNMFNNYKNQIGPEVGAIWDGIQQPAAATGVDHRVILAIIMQESHGCVRVHTTNGGVRNPSLMQDHNGSATCTAGTNSGDGLANCINQSSRHNVSAFYRAARIYNSGSILSTRQL